MNWKGRLGIASGWFAVIVCRECEGTKRQNRVGKERCVFKGWSLQWRVGWNWIVECDPQTKEGSMNSIGQQKKDHVHAKEWVMERRNGHRWTERERKRRRKVGNSKSLILSSTDLFAMWCVSERGHFRFRIRNRVSIVATLTTLSSLSSLSSLSYSSW